MKERRFLYLILGFAGLVVGAITYMVITQSGWNDTRRAEFLELCKQQMNPSAGVSNEALCSCLLEKTVRAFPDPDEFEMGGAGVLSSLADSCLSELRGEALYWPEESKNAFLTGCRQLAEERKLANPEAYCACVLQGVQKEYPRSNDLQSVSSETIQAIGKSCE